MRMVWMRMMVAVMMLLVMVLLLLRESRLPVGMRSGRRRRRRRRRCILMLHGEISKHGLNCVCGIQLVQSVVRVVAERRRAILVVHHLLFQLMLLRLVRSGAAMQARCGVR